MKSLASTIGAGVLYKHDNDTVNDADANFGNIINNAVYLC